MACVMSNPLKRSSVIQQDPAGGCTLQLAISKQTILFLTLFYFRCNWLKNMIQV